MRVFGLLLALALLLVPSLAHADGDLANDAQRLDRLAAEVDRAAASADWATARRQWDAYRALWREVEDGFAAAAPDAYASIEASQRQVRQALAADPPNPSAVRAPLAELHQKLAPFAAGQITDAMPVHPTVDGLRDALTTLTEARDAAARSDATAAQAALGSFQRQWPTVEGLVKARDAEVYRSTEDGMADAAAALKSDPSRAAARLDQMVRDLAPIAQAGTQYGVADAAIILFREGLEALLVVAALLAFLTRAGHADKRRWVWSGAALGVATSAVAAFAVQSLFSNAFAGASRELVEGITGLAAAAMLLYVSYWLHSKASLAAWQRYIRERTSTALVGGGLWSLALISFLAVFREGAETVLFYVGIAPSIALTDLALGLAIGAGALAAIGVAMLIFGLRIPIRPFFVASSALLYYLAFKFVGTGVHALQVAGLAPATPVPVPSVDVIGLFPTRETTLPQLLLLLVAVAVVLWSRRRRPAAEPAAA
jgi:high-affinity iron transporter